MSFSSAKPLQAIEAPHAEISCLRNQGVRELFMDIARFVLRTYEEEKESHKKEKAAPRCRRIRIVSPPLRCWPAA